MRGVLTWSPSQTLQKNTIRTFRLCIFTMQLTFCMNSSLEWMSKQFFLGGKLLKSSRKVSVFNAVVRREIAKRKENGKHSSLIIATMD